MREHVNTHIVSPRRVRVMQFNGNLIPLKYLISVGLFLEREIHAIFVLPLLEFLGQELRVVIRIVLGNE